MALLASDPRDFIADSLWQSRAGLNPKQIQRPVRSREAGGVVILHPPRRDTEELRNDQDETGVGVGIPGRQRQADLFF